MPASNEVACRSNVRKGISIMRANSTRLRLNSTRPSSKLVRQNSADLRPNFTRLLLCPHLAPSCRVPMAVSIQAL
jgi:hypothetical protein